MVTLKKLKRFKMLQFPDNRIFIKCTETTCKVCNNRKH